MPYPLGAVTVQAGQTYPVVVGSTGTVGAVVIANESPYSLQVSANSSGTGGQWIVAQTVDLVTCDTTSFNGTLSITTDNYLSNAVYAPSFLIYLTAYAPGEPIRGTYPAPLMRLSNGGTVGTPSNTLEQDMWTPFVLGDTITPSHTGNTYQTSTGVAFLRQSDNSVLRVSVNATSQNLTGISTTYYHDLNPDGSFSLGTAHSTQPNYLTIATITTNSSGNITTLTDTRVLSSTLWNGMQNVAGAQGVNLYNLHAYKNIQADNLISVQGKFHVSSPSTGQGYNIGSDGSSDLVFTPDNNSASSSIYFSVNSTGTPPLTTANVLSLGGGQLLGSVQIDTGGVVHANAPVTLVNGYQETGRVGIDGYIATAGISLGSVVNFKTNLTNVPTSISYSVTESANTGTINTNLIDRYGFHVYQTPPTINSSSFWHAVYTTVGNCLLAVNAGAGTFDHHCDSCGHVSTAAPLSAVEHAPGQYAAMSYTCPACGAIEAFNCALAAADEADTSPQGSGQYATTRGAQATLIRSLMTALGLPVL